MSKTKDIFAKKNLNCLTDNIEIRNTLFCGIYGDRWKNLTYAIGEYDPGQLKMGEYQAKYGALFFILPLLSGLGKSFHGWTFWTLYFSGLSGNLSAEPWIYERIRTRRRVSTTGFIRFHFNFSFFKLRSISWIQCTGYHKLLGKTKWHLANFCYHFHFVLHNAKKDIFLSQKAKKLPKLHACFFR